MYSQTETTMATSPSKLDLTFQAAYGRPSNGGESPLRSTIASFMAIEELGGLLGPFDGEANSDESQPQLEAQLETDVDSGTHDLKEKRASTVDLEVADSGVMV